MESQTAIPARRAWLGAFKRAGLAALVVLPMMHWCWSAYARWRLEQKVKHVRAAGKPALLGDFVRPMIASKVNAAEFYELASTRFIEWSDTETIHPRDLWEVLDQTGPAALLARHGQLIGSQRSQAQAVLALLREGCSQEQAVFTAQRELRSPLTDHLDYSQALKLVALAKFAAVVTVWEAKEGLTREALSRIEEMLTISGHIQQGFTLLDVLLGLRVEAIAAVTVEAVSRWLTATDRECIARLAARLIDDQSHLLALERALRFEGCLLLDTVEAVIDGHTASDSLQLDLPAWLVSSRASRFCWMPALRLDASAAFMEIHELATCVARGDLLVNLRGSDMHRSSTQPLLSRMTRGVRTSVAASGYSSVEVVYRQLALRRMAGVALAIRLFELDHGSRPETLNHLVPTYLPQLPEDPFHPAGRTFGYLAAGRGARLYSVGVDHEDQGGAFAVVTDSPAIDVGPGDTPLFFLDADRPYGEELVEFSDPQLMKLATPP